MKIRILTTVILFGYLFNHHLSAQTYGWGNNETGQLGLGNANSPQPGPVLLGSAADDVTGVGGGYDHTLFLKADGTVLATGANQSGQLGDGTTNTRTTLGPVNGLTDVVALSAGSRHSLALLSNGTVMAWGRTFEGQLGGGGESCNPSAGYGLTPALIPGLSNVIAIDTGSGHSLALKSDGTVWAWGLNFNGQTGIGVAGGDTCSCQTVPVQVGVGVSGFNNIIAISGGEGNTIALKSDGTVWVWGSNLFGAIGNGTAGGDQLSPVQNTGITGVSQISGGFNFNVALKPDGTVFAWGFNTRGNLGNGTSGAASLIPVQSTITNVVDIKTAGAHTLAKKSDGSIWAWGWNQHGEVGIGTSDTGGGCQCRSTPVQTLAGTGNPIFGVGRYHSFVAKPSVTLQAAGSNIPIVADNFSLLFLSISSVTTITASAIDPNSTGLTVPTGYAILANSAAYDFTATPAVKGTIIPCVKVPNVFSQTQFAGLRLLHGEGTTLVDRTVLPNNYQIREVCASVTSLSPFVIAEDLSPTAVNVSVGGRVMTASGRGVSRAFVVMTDTNGVRRRVATSSFGYFLFDDVPVGETYVVSASHKLYGFSPRIVTVSDSISDLYFTADAFR